VYVSKDQYSGEVYSLRVLPHSTYVSGGAAVGNSVKGAQWTNVTVLMPKGIFPFEPKRKPDEPPPDPVVEAARLKAERNLAYVALTRAAVNLEVSCPLKSGMSPFVFQAGLQVGENVPKAGMEGAQETILVKQEAEPYSSTGSVYRAYRADGTPLYMGAETFEKLKSDLLSYHPNAKVELAPEEAPKQASEEETWHPEYN